MTDKVSELLDFKTAPSNKCTAHSKRTGAPCNNPPVVGLTVCRMHGGATKAAKAAARRRLDEAAERMAKQLLKIADSAESEAVRLAAVKDALDRAGLKAPDKVDVEVGVRPWESLADKIVGIGTLTREESRARRGISEPAALDSQPHEHGHESPQNERTSAPSDGEIVDAEIVDEPPADRGYRAGPTYRGDADDNSRGRPGPNTTPPGKGLVPYEDAVALANRANKRAGVYDKRYRR